MVDDFLSSQRKSLVGANFQVSLYLAYVLYPNFNIEKQKKRNLKIHNIRSKSLDAISSLEVFFNDQNDFFFQIIASVERVSIKWLLRLSFTSKINR